MSLLRELAANDTLLPVTVMSSSAFMSALRTGTEFSEFLFRVFVVRLELQQTPVVGNCQIAIAAECFVN